MLMEILEEIGVSCMSWTRRDRHYHSLLRDTIQRELMSPTHFLIALHLLYKLVIEAKLFFEN